VVGEPVSGGESIPTVGHGCDPSQQIRDGDGDQPGVQDVAHVVLALHGGGDGDVDVGEQADRGPEVPGRPADDLPDVQAGALLGQLVIFRSLT